MEFRETSFFVFATVAITCGLISTAAVAFDHVYSKLNKAEGSRSNSKGRVGDVSNLGEVIWCTTRRFPLDYNDYGCYCGLGSYSSPPVDRIDRCCELHDECYEDAGNHNCSCHFETYTMPYLWLCKRPSDDAEPQNRHPKAECWSYQPLGDCAAKVCDCDVALANCFAKYKYPEIKPSCPKKSLILKIL